MSDVKKSHPTVAFGVPLYILIHPSLLPSFPLPPSYPSSPPLAPSPSRQVTRNGLRVCDLRHMDTFRSKLELLYKEAAARFPAFSYTEADLDAEVAKYREFAARLAPLIADSVYFVDAAVKGGKRVLVEGGQATMLDIDFGTYPYVTSSNPSVGGICPGLGLAPRHLDDIIGVVSSSCQRTVVCTVGDEFHLDLQSVETVRCIASR